jgi:hypothetical protein
MLIVYLVITSQASYFLFAIHLRQSLIVNRYSLFIILPVSCAITYTIMGQIKLEGMSFYAHHGYYTHERTRGNNYMVDITLETKIDKAALEDDLHYTINYEVIYRICNDIMEQPAG